jgi:hypothetical protein
MVRNRIMLTTEWYQLRRVTRQRYVLTTKKVAMTSELIKENQ